ncbi:MAG: hypothetical protein NVSMB32_15070 [Actinomycetota bacterium]
MAATPDGRGYWLVATDGGIFSFGDAGFFGSPASLRGVSPIVGMAAAPGGNGYWLAANDGGIFAYGGATFFGSAGGTNLASPVIGLATSQRLGTGTVGIFYYPWYASAPMDGQWRHWDEGGHSPPNDIGATYFPARGAYSSKDAGVIDAQMAEIAATGVNQVIVSWWGQGSFEDKALAQVQRLAIAHGLQVAIHLEPYGGRSASTVASDIATLMARGISQFYVYQASGIASAAWAGVRAQFPTVLLFAHGSVGGTRSGGLANFALAGGFDGIYTYDPFNFSGSEFAGICATAQADGLVCAPSVAPGYDATRSTGDTHVQGRNGGATYDSRWAGAIAAGAGGITITSYNEWHESSQIEPAMPFCIPNQGSCYADYAGDFGLSDPASRSGYLDRTTFWVARYRASL